VGPSGEAAAVSALDASSGSRPALRGPAAALLAGHSLAATLTGICQAAGQLVPDGVASLTTIVGDFSTQGGSSAAAGRLDALQDADGTGGHSSLSLPITVGDAIAGALTVSAMPPDGVDDGARETLHQLAELAATAVSNAELYATTASTNHELAQVFAARAQVEQARGILMGSRYCTADEAFDILVTLSQQSGTTLRAAAAELISTITDE
jgi:hypothetical protein